MSSFPERLKAARDRKALTQTALAKASRVSRKSIVRYESGESEPFRPSAERIAEALAVNPDWLLSGDGDMDAPPVSLPAPSPPEATPREATLREPLAMKGADPDDWEGEAPAASGVSEAGETYGAPNGLPQGGLPPGVLFEIRGPQGVIYRLTIQAEQVGEPLRTYARAAEAA